MELAPDLICEWRNCLRDPDILFMGAWLCLRHYMVVHDALITTAAAGKPPSRAIFDPFDGAGGAARDLGVNLSASDCTT